MGARVPHAASSGRDVRVNPAHCSGQPGERPSNRPDPAANRAVLELDHVYAGRRDDEEVDLATCSVFAVNVKFDQTYQGSASGGIPQMASRPQRSWSNSDSVRSSTGLLACIRSDLAPGPGGTP
jgi:hypothetical protein